MRRLDALARVAALVGCCTVLANCTRAADDPSERGPVRIASSHGFDAYKWRVDGDDLYIVPNTSVMYWCGKGCVRTVASPAPARLALPSAQAALAKLTDEDRLALGLPPADDPRVSGLSKLSPAERQALGLEGHAMIEAPAGVLAFGFLPGYERKGLYGLDEVFARVPERPRDNGGFADFDGDVMKMGSARYRLFRRQRTCVSCGLEGVFFAKERSARVDKATGAARALGSADWHFNMYGLREVFDKKKRTTEIRGVLMTKDHILPRKRGGADVDWNYQTMCSPCNCRKADRLPTERLLDHQREALQRALSADASPPGVRTIELPDITPEQKAHLLKLLAATQPDPQEMERPIFGPLPDDFYLRLNR